MRRLALFALLLCGSVHGQEPVETLLFESGKGGYDTYRIPALAATPKGTLLAICEGRKTSSSDHGDVDLVFKRSTDGGTKWSETTLLYEEGGDAKITIGNPCVVVDEAKRTVLLLFTRDNTAVFMTASSDEGQTWSKPRDITSSAKKADWTWYATGPGNGIQLTGGKYKGRLVVPCDHRVQGVPDKKASSRSHVIFSDDNGQTWQIGGASATHMNECALAELSDGTLLLNMRSFRGKARRGIATSKDGGMTWSPVEDDATLIEPVCQASLLRYAWSKDKNVLVFANPADTKARKNMTVRLSYDDGRTWPISKTVWPGSAIYSSLARLPDGNIGLLYERDNYRQIVLTRIAQEWFEKGK